MATSPIQFVSAATLPSSAAQLDSYQTPANTTDKLYEILLHNSHTSPVSVELWLVPSGGSRDAASKIFKRTLAVDETYQIGLEQRMTVGYQIHGGADTASVVSVNASGDRVTI